MMSFANRHPRVAGGMTLTAAEVEAILLGAIRRRSEEEEPC
ncbi:hypothetical protein [Sorangium cellulosum]|uniref:Uncharacterized protein n=1 Tax=Sorangium cellulosum So0157-2 TaxID=1254432 RepID=S4Y4B7_SORCE|nr:hypothetical protein [Sorangium cellulosum]AGP39659.1 hypothetical protein SCE1572_37320 [Sorangium cellulosum So0157-2]